MGPQCSIYEILLEGGGRRLGSDMCCLAWRKLDVEGQCHCRNRRLPPAGEYAIYAQQSQPNSLPGGEVSAWIVSWLWVPFNALLVYVALLYPNGRPPSKGWRPVAWLVGIAAVAAVTVEASLPIPVCNVCSVENPLGIEGLRGVGNLVDPLIEAFWYGALGLVAVTSLYVRFRHASDVERQQIKWLAYAASVVVVGTTLAYGVHGATGIRWTWPVGIAL